MPDFSAAAAVTTRRFIGREAATAVDPAEAAAYERSRPRGARRRIELGESFSGDTRTAFMRRWSKAFW